MEVMMLNVYLCLSSYERKALTLETEITISDNHIGIYAEH